ncbi:MAG: hypothetical protein WD426_17320 [Anditalea sp.]
MILLKSIAFPQDLEVITTLAWGLGFSSGLFFDFKPNRGLTKFILFIKNSYKKKEPMKVPNIIIAALGQNPHSISIR